MHKKTTQVTVTAILAALICVATMIVQIPIPAREDMQISVMESF